jgi:cytochrome c oxidase cbb3-type subunit III
MMSERILNKPAMLLAGLFFSLTFIVSFSQTQEGMRRGTHVASGQSGQRVFASNCSGCHGLDGTGTQRAPNIVSNPQVQKLSAEEIFRIVSEGVPGTGMPAFKHLGKASITATVAYVRNLQGKKGPARLPGDPKNGEVVFFGAGQCSNCHMISGRGGFIGPDLSSYGQTHSADAIKAAITNPAARDRQQGVATAITTTGQHYEGIIRNEDNFSLQLQSTDGAFHFISKSDLKTIDRTQGSMMPSDFGSKLSEGQLNDLVSYLLKAAEVSTPPDTHHPEEE